MSDFPSEVEVSIDVYHLPTAAGTQSYPSSPDATITGALLPLERKEQVLEGGSFVQPYELYVSGDEDVRVADKLVIPIDTNGNSISTNFYVKYVFPANFGSLAHKRISLSTES